MRLSSRKQRARAVGVTVLAAILTVLGACPVANAATSPDPTTSQQDWQTRIVHVPQPTKGCYTAAYPRLEWREIGCTATPTYPMPPTRGPRPLVMGNRNDIAAQVPAGSFISTGIGSFENVTNVTSESSPIGNSGPPVANAYTLQMNTNFFTSTVCAASPNPGCQGWQQFVFENYGSGGRAFIQYWLLRYNAACPAGGGWNTFSFTGDTDIYCWKNNSLGAVPVPNQPITNIANLSLSGTVSAGGDSVTMFVGAMAYSRNGDNAVNAAAGWNVAEFNVFGDGGNSDGGSMASFNAGAALTVRTRVIYGGRAAPTCVVDGFTGETNNLTLATPAPPMSPPGPAVIFNESTAGTALTNCSDATTVGDPHLHTFAGLFYDFQATGDFVLAQVDPDFEVQARHVSGAPTWPNAAVNQAAATRMGGEKVAFCGGKRVVVNGRSVDLADGATLSLPGGVDLTRRGNAYFVTDQGGNSVRATVRSGYVDVSVGLGTWPTKVRGLLGNPGNEVGKLEARDGTVFDVPLSFDDLYHRFGNSWRVSPADSLLSVCGPAHEYGNPKKPFFARDLDPGLRERAYGVCRQAGVEDAALIQACALDVAVLGEKAATVYVGATAPVLDGNP
jgi:von Willebrand factor type D domain